MTSIKCLNNLMVVELSDCKKRSFLSERNRTMDFPTVCKSYTYTQERMFLSCSHTFVEKNNFYSLLLSFISGENRKLDHVLGKRKGDHVSEPYAGFLHKWWPSWLIVYLLSSFYVGSFGQRHVGSLRRDTRRHTVLLKSHTRKPEWYFFVCGFFLICH